MANRKPAKQKPTPRKRTSAQLKKIDKRDRLSNKVIAKKLGVSERTLYNYKSGKSKPKNKIVASKIQRLFKDLLPSVTHYCSIEDYITANKIYATDGRMDALLKLSDAGYICAWQGSENIPLEVEFLAGGAGAKINNSGYMYNIIVHCTKKDSPKPDENGKGKYPQEKYEYIRTFHVTEKELKINSNMSFTTRDNIIREWVMENVSEKFHYKPLAYLGYYIKENEIR